METKPRPRLSRGCYTLGWICPLPLELTAAMSMLDEVHQPLPQPPEDANTYVLGRVASHDIVLACLPEMGPTPAATVIERMSTTFPDLRCALLVGIGGGIPSKQHDIRLGDVVVGVPGTQHGAVVQWDFGKTIAGGEFIHRGIMRDPPPLLLTAINTLRAQSAFGSPALQTYLSQGIDRLAENERRNFQRPSDSLDLLFEAEYDSQHPQEGGCHDCDKERIVPRTQRAQQQVPIVHFGTIASGNQVIKHGAKRSQIGEQFQALCIEMEAAGVVKNFPCLVIRGICDYSDSHKNKAWQGHAAMAAAALAKHLLSIIPTSNVNTDMEPGAVFLHGTAPIKLTPVSRRDLSRGEGRWWQDYWHMDDIPQRMHPPPDPSQQAFIQEKRRELENSIAELQSAALESNKTTEIKIAEFMAEYYPVVEDQVANFQLPSQRLAVFSAMIRMTKGSLDRDTMSIRTLLHYMAMNGVHEVLPKLVEIGFGLNDTDSDYQTPLHLAVICNHDEAARVLVEDCKADVHVPDLNGLLPWHHALVIDWDNLAENSAREDSKRCIIRLLAKVTDATKVKGTNARRKLIKIQENPQAEIVF